MRPWLQFFRVVNLPTVPGDLLVGAAFSVAWMGSELQPFTLLSSVFASLALYLFGLADNDLVGAATDGPERPIPAGHITRRAAKVARALCLASAFGAGILHPHSPAWWSVAGLLALVIVIYNRTKNPLLMGLTRGLNVLLGGCALVPAAIWTLYIAGVTKYSEGEETDPVRKRRVGVLIGLLVYLQLIVLILCVLVNPLVKPLLLTGAVLLLVLRLLKRLLPRVHAS